MEKIIAVVVMIAIVIGLIATAVLPYVSSMNDAASEGQNQLNQFTGTIQGDSMTGAAVAAEIKSYAPKFAVAGGSSVDKITNITVMGLQTMSDHIDITSSAQINTEVPKIPAAAMYTKATTTYPSGKVKTITYTIVNVGQN